MHRIIHLLLAILLMLPAVAVADGLIVVHNPPPMPGHFAFAPLEVAYHHVNVKIEDRLATTSVDQEFFNPNSQRLEGTYLFPLPEGAIIDRFSMDIDGTMVEAELLDAGKARQTYEEIVRRYQDPALLEYVGRGAMKVRIFPIEPNSRKRIKLSYTQVLNIDSDVMEYTYPLNTEKFSARPLRSVSVNVDLTSNTPIKSIYSPTHDVEVRPENEKRAVIGFEAKDTRPDIDFKLIVTRQPDPVGLSLLAHREPGQREGYFMLLASPGFLESRDEIQPKNICFVLDTSGSMAGPKLEQAKKALLFCLANLNTGDRFEIIRFSTEAENLFGSFVDAKPQNLEKAREFVGRLKPIGGTAIDSALALALALPRDGSRPTSIIFLTDGQPTIGERNEDRIVSRIARPDMKLRVFPFGLGTDVNTNLLDRIANQTHAFPQYVLPAEDIEVKVSNFYTRIQSPVMTDIRLELSGSSDVRISHLYPGELPDLFRGQTLVAFGRYSGGGQSLVQIAGMRNGQRAVFQTSFNFPEEQTGNSFIPRLWATRRVGWLLDEIRLHGESKELVDEVTQLARQHGIVTPYTAYLILEDERRRDGVWPSFVDHAARRDSRSQ
ncbi:VIT domain-containing protein [Fontivita pretiosa]|uniref:VIT domain-containing protein n=1 Tax=Fontivita pretiosa TaxID=2989684 RepID=UPI003D165127